MTDYQAYLHLKTAKEKDKRELKKELRENKSEIATFITFMFLLGNIFSFIKFYLTSIVM